MRLFCAECEREYETIFNNENVVIARSISWTITFLSSIFIFLVFVVVVQSSFVIYFSCMRVPGI